jgi:hypothetical protein
MLKEKSGIEVTELTLAKIYIFCQMSSPSRGFLKSIGPTQPMISLALKTPSYNTNTLPKAFFDKTVFVKFNISNNFEQDIDKNNQKSIG